MKTDSLFHMTCSVLLVGAIMAGGIFADNPIISHRFTADPNAMVYDGRVYVYCSNDDDNNNSYDIASYILISSDDMVNWTDHGEVFRVPRDASWANRAYAPTCIERDGKFYLYFPDGGNSIGVAVAGRPEGPFKDPLGKALITKSMPNCNVQWCFDPAIFIDDDGKAYLYFGGGQEGTGTNLRGIELNDDMISVKGTAKTIEAQGSFEASFMHKYNGIYYFSYATTGASKIDYLMGDNPLGPLTYKGTALPNPTLNGQNINKSNNNHSSIVEFEDKWYMFYHDRRISNEVYKRNASADLLTHAANGTINTVKVTAESVPQVKNLNPYDTVQAETIDKQKGIETDVCSEGGMMLTSLAAGDYTGLSGVDFGDGASEFEVRAASASGGGTVEVHLGSQTGTLAGSCEISATGGWTTWKTFSCDVSGCSGVKNLYFVYKGSGEPFRCNWFRFIPVPTGMDEDRDHIRIVRRDTDAAHLQPVLNMDNLPDGFIFDLSGRILNLYIRNHRTDGCKARGVFIVRNADDGRAVGK
ncbi:MAG: family 43 glycosylhydrolase [Chitinispirillaceae bacterium]|nr:family 43 glycosylhydrolase [Chitinispirillaceae bacterium]